MGITNGSFEDGLSTLPAWPEDWTLTAAAFMWGFLDFGAPYGYSEGFEAGWDSNEDSIDAFELSDLTDMLFDSGGTSESVEDFEELWDNAAYSEWPETGVAATFDAAGDDVEDFEEEWPSKHTVIDDRSITYYPLATTLSDAAARSRLNDLKATYEAHRVDTDHHTAADTTNAISSPDCTDESSTVTLVNEMWVDCWAHMQDTASYHLEVPIALSRPTEDYPATNYNEAKILLMFLELKLFLHFTWGDCSGQGYAEYFIHYTEATGSDNIRQSVIDGWFDSTDETYEDFEEEWRDNEDSISAFTPGVTLEAFGFFDDGGPVEYEDFETKADLSFPGVSDTAGSEKPLSPTLASQVECTGTFVGTAYVETRNKGSATWIQRSTITTVPVTIELDTGYEAVRIYTEVYTSGSPDAELHFLED